jgi:hypothetical protein
MAATAEGTPAGNRPLSWDELLEAVSRERADAIETTIAKMRSLESYGSFDDVSLRDTVESRFSLVIDGLAARRPPGSGLDESAAEGYGEERARQGVTFADMLSGWRFGGNALYRLGRDVAPAAPNRDALLLEYVELTLLWIDFASLAMASGHRRGELSRARELQHVQGNLVRRALAGTASHGEMRNGLGPLGLDPEATYVVFRARPGALAEVHEIERYLQVDGLHGRRRGLAALIDGDLCGFVVAALPRAPAPTAIGVSEPARLSALADPFRRASRALEAAIAFGADGIFEFATLAVQAGIVGDPDAAAVLLARYLEPLRDSLGGEVVLETAKRYLANDGSVELTARSLEVHSNTVRHRLKRFEELTGRSLNSSETVAEFWLAVQAEGLRGS